MDTGYQRMMKWLVVVLLVANVFCTLYIAFFKPGAYALETLKAGGRQNIHTAKQLYTSPAYIQQQKSTLEQILKNMTADASITQ